MNKEEFLLSLPDSISLTEALSDVARIFTKLSFIYRKKSQGDLEKYICFHKELKWGVYKHEDKYFLVRIIHPPKLFGFEGNSSVAKVTEVLTGTTDHSDLEKKSIRGSILLGKTSDSEKLFLQAITDEGTKEAFEEIAGISPGEMLAMIAQRQFAQSTTNGDAMAIKAITEANKYIEPTQDAKTANEEKGEEMSEEDLMTRLLELTKVGPKDTAKH